MAEHGLQAPLLALAWDGLGLGEDGALWGGEFLVIERQGYRRVASFLPLPLIGGEKAVREPRRAALAALHGICGGDCLAHLPEALQGAFSPQERPWFLHMLERQLNTPPCSSLGRLFDAVSALLGLCFVNQFEGQAAMLLEAAAQSGEADEMPPYPFALLPGDPLRVDWRPLLKEILAEQSRGVPANRLAARFHLTLAEIAVQVAALAGKENVVLGGGCFQNRLLLESCAARLGQAGYGVHWPQRIPTNDGGLALGQLIGAARQLHET
jgi:hydrogenase maturation protein HypF